MYTLHSVRCNIHLLFYLDIVMLKIISVFFSALSLGAMLNLNTFNLTIRPGYIGSVLIIIGAVWIKQYWKRREVLIGDEPNPAERNVWLWMSGTALICGFVITVLYQPGSEVHTKTGGTGGYDSWLMFGGVLIAYLILRNKNPQIDERDINISHAGTKAGFYSLIFFLSILIFSLGFAPKDVMQRFTHWLIANLLVCLIMLSCLAQYMAQLFCYWRDSHNLKAQQ